MLIHEVRIGKLRTRDLNGIGKEAAIWTAFGSVPWS